MANETSPMGQAHRAYEQFEGQLAAALEQFVATNGFADLLATSATNVMAAQRIANVTVDRVVRSTRLATHQDVVDLARQLARTQEKLERVLQAVEELGDRVDALSQAGVPDAGRARPADSGTAPASRNGRARRARSGTARAARRPAGEADDEAERQDAALAAIPPDEP